MKKNIRIISAAAAALLAVSPVVASSVVNPNNASVVQADKEDKNTVTSKATAPSINNSEKISDITSENWIKKNVVLTKGSIASVIGAHLEENKKTLSSSDSLVGGKNYDLVIHARISNLHNSTKHLTLNGASAKVTDGISDSIVFSVPVHVYDPSAAGVPQFIWNKNGAVLDNGAYAPSEDGISVTNGETVQQILDAAKGSVKFRDTMDNSVDNDQITTTVDDVISELKSQGVTVSGSGANAKVTATNGFNVTLTGKTLTNGTTATVKVPFVPAGATVTDAPIIQVATKGMGQSSFGTPTKAENGKTYQIASGTTFNATDFVTDNGTEIKFSAVQSDKNNAAATLTSSGSVDTSKPGTWYPVTLTATNNGKKTSSITINILVAPNGQQEVYSGGATYNIYGDNVQATGSSVKVGDKVYVGDSKIINNVSYSKISTTSKAAANAGNTWIKTSDLTKPATPAETSEEHTVMVTSKAYDKNGNYLGHNYQYTSTINIVPKAVLINGKTYYKVAGKDEYVRVTNITGTPRTLRHNAYIYWSSYRRTPGTGKMYRGQHVTTYGAAIRFKNGKRYYRISGCTPSNKRYIKQANFF